LPGARFCEKAIAHVVANLNWTVEEAAEGWVALRTARAADTRHFTHFVAF
jgi:hypothetical protein